MALLQLKTGEYAMSTGGINSKSNNLTSQTVCFLSPFLLLILGLVEFNNTGCLPLIVDTAIVALFALFAMLLGKIRKYDLSYFEWASIATVVVLPFYLLSLSWAIIVLVVVYTLYFIAFNLARLISEGEIVIYDSDIVFVGVPALALAIFASLIFFSDLFRCIQLYSFPVIAVTVLLAALHAKVLLDIVESASFRHGYAIVKLSRGSVNFAQVVALLIIYASLCSSAFMFILSSHLCYLHDSIVGSEFLTEVSGASFSFMLAFSAAYILTLTYISYSVSERYHSHPKLLKIVKIDKKKFTSVIELKS